MEYKRFGDTLLVRIDRGEEILTQLKSVALSEKMCIRDRRIPTARAGCMH